WQVQTTPGGAWANVANGVPYTGATTDTLRINPVATSMNGYNYRIVYSGSCAMATFTTTATLTVTPIVATVTPTTALICNGSIQQLSLTNSLSAATTSTFSAATLPVVIPDGIPLPLVSTPIPMVVSGIPAGSVITNIGVRFTMTHNFVGDIIVNLKAPNGQQLSLVNLLDGGNANNTSDNFTNTVIDSTATLNISGAAAPRTGTYRAEKFLLTDPDYGNLITTNRSWAALLSTLSGTWSLEIADPFLGDVGTVTAAEIFFTYSAPVLAQGTWDGPTGTIFTDAGGTIPYTGMPATSVFVKPIVNGVNNYTVNFVSGGCTSTKATIPVTVVQLPTSLGTIADQAICGASNVTFTATPVGGAAFTSQWQLSTDNGATFSTIANGGVYSGATTNSLTITGAPASFNGYRFRRSASAAPCTGSVTSTAATLTVNPMPTVTIGVAPVRNLFPGLTTTLTATVFPAPNGATYQWFRNGVAVVGATNRTIVVGIDGLGTYTVRVVDGNGCNTNTATSTPVVSQTIADSAVFTRLFIYPSPNNGQFQVRYFNDVTNNGLVPSVLNVYDSKGARVFSKRYAIGGGYQPLNVDLGASRGRGVYRIDLLTSKGERIKTGTVLVM
ncbi:MAG: hypothetical protein ACKVOM_04870, partial [Ferruginibacter sp.]